MKTERPKQPGKNNTRKPPDEEFAPRAEPKRIVPQSRCDFEGDPFEAILDAYARDIERWDGLE